jgi:N-succinyldiaminopimelate aminotransferase
MEAATIEISSVRCVVMQQPLFAPINRDHLINRALAEFGTTIFAEMSALAIATNSINLGQGFPDTDGPEVIKAAASRAIADGHNQYPPGRGIAALREAVALHQARFYGIELDPEEEVLITAGATEAITAAIIGLCEPGDEVLLFEPYYDSYVAAIAIAGARRVTVALRPPNWSFDIEEIRRVITPRSRVLLLNSPHNPTGKVFSREELAAIAEFAIAHNLIVITDEVYEHLSLTAEHLPISRLPGMSERTLTVSSAGKTFSFTGWKIGWASGPRSLVNATLAAKQFLTYVNGAPFQVAIAEALTLPDSYFSQLRLQMLEQRDLLGEGLRRLDFEVLLGQGTYFLNIDLSSRQDCDGLSFCRELPGFAGVVAIPTAVFYDTKEIGRSLVRFAFCKRPEVIEEALRRMRIAFGQATLSSPIV